MLCIPTYIIRQKGKKHNFQIAKKIVKYYEQIVKCDIFLTKVGKENLIFSKKEIKLSGKETSLPIGRQFSNNVYNILTGKNIEYH